jgi:hypothetical protein
MAKHFYPRAGVILLVTGMLFVLPLQVMATAVDRMALCNMEGRAGETIETSITLQGNETQGRTGFWSAYYKQVDGDDERMDITSWITIEPQEYAIIDGQSLTFSISVKVPQDASSGLWGATSEEAGQAGHSGERRTYIIYKDAITGGNVYSGLLIPVSVKVLGKTSSTTPLNFITDNLLVIVLGAIIVILLVVILTRKGAKRTRLGR